MQYNLVLTKAALDKVAAHYAKVDAFCFDVETMGDHRGEPYRNRVVWIGLACEGRVDVIAMGHPNGDFVRTEFPLLKTGVARQAKGLPLRDSDYSRDARKAKNIFTPPPTQLEPGEVFAALAPAFFGPAEKSGHNVGFDLQSVAKYFGDLPARPYFDTMSAAHVLDSRNKNWLGLDDCLKREFGFEMKKGVGKFIEGHSFNEVALYAAIDVGKTWDLRCHYKARLAAEGGNKPFRVDMDVLEVTCDMELEGALLDVPDLKTLHDNLETQIEEKKGEVYRAAGKPFALNSTRVKVDLLYGSKKDGGRGLRPRKLTPGGKKKFVMGQETGLYDWSTDAEALEHYRDVDDLATALLEYADVNKLMSTYVIPYLGGDVVRTTGGKSKTVTKESLMHEGRVHTRFKLTGAETGRFSSANPNLQNVPNPRTLNGKAIRNLFIAPPGHRLVVADYSQIEPRIIASFTGDPRLVGTYVAGQDIYTTIAGPFGLDRAAGKVLMLALSYGIGPDKIAATIGISLQAAKQLLLDFEEEFREIYRYKARVIKQARARRPVPYVETLLGRRRYLPDLKSEKYGLKSRAERQGFNHGIQGSAADIMKVAMIRAHRMIPEPAKLILTVHDELVTATPIQYADRTAEAIRQAMEGINVLKVPLVADVKVVDRWGEAK